MELYWLFKLLLCCVVVPCRSSDITSTAFKDTNVMPAAFGDFNSDEITDLFVINSDSSSFEVLLGKTSEPFFESSHIGCKFKDLKISSIVPGDFDGDALMDVLVTTFNATPDKQTAEILTYVFVEWGAFTYLNCTESPVFEMIDEPLALVYDKNMSTELFGMNKDHEPVFWSLTNRGEVTMYPLTNQTSMRPKLRIPHSHGIVDLNDDNAPDLYLTTENGYEIWLWDTTSAQFVYNNTLNLPPGYKIENIGQTLFMDLETNNKMDYIVPACLDKNCQSSSIFAYSSGEVHDLRVNFNDGEVQWGFRSSPNPGRYMNVITMHGGDFNNDGYVDMLATLGNANGDYRSFLLENVPCTDNCSLSRTFHVQWSALSPYNENTVMGTFYDFQQDAILDIIFVKYVSGNYSVAAFKNSLDYDANFIKVMVITGKTNKEIELAPSILGTQRSMFVTNFPGPTIRYQTTTQDGNPQAGVAVQLPQSAHFSLYLPYTIFGLGRTPNFVEDLTVGMFNHSKTWTQIIPNSQLVVIPYPPDNPSNWKALLFVTPSKIILQTALALTGTCIVIAAIIGVLHWKERREDKIEKLQESHRFHFDAM